MQAKAKKRVFRRMKVKLRAAVCWFPNDMKGQRIAHIQVTCFKNILRIRRFIYLIFPSPDV